MTVDPYDYVVGTMFSQRLLPFMGEFIAYFSTMNTQFDRLIWHLLGVDIKTGSAITSAIPNYRPRTVLLENLAKSKIEDEGDRKKLIKIAHEFTRVAEYRHRMLHDDAMFYDPATITTGVWRADIHFHPQPPTQVSPEWLRYMSALSFHLTARMQQYLTKNANWNGNAEHFPWHDKPLQPPRKNTPPP